MIIYRCKAFLVDGSQQNQQSGILGKLLAAGKRVLTGESFIYDRIY
jgi:hypothetical protein